jgi:hypothetical protein
MNAQWRDRAFRVVLAPLIMAGGLIIISPGAASASTCESWTGIQPTNPSSIFNGLGGVAVLTPCNAWAVGTYSNGSAGQTLIEHWNGTAWKQVPSPDPGGSAAFNSLSGVAATSAGNAWAVGTYFNGTWRRTLIEHWNGSAWTRVPSPNPGPSQNVLSGVSATSASNAWAVGGTGICSGGVACRTLIEHWNDTAWKVVPSPKGGLSGVAATSARNAWAVGSHVNGTTGRRQTLIEHWNGTAWKQVPSPNPSSALHYGNELSDVAATSASNAWAVGSYANATTGGTQTLIEHWNGSTWKHVSSPNPARINILSGVAATSASNVWAVGFYVHHNEVSQTLIEHWNGTVWKQVPSPNPSFSENGLGGVAATSSNNVWAVGDYRSVSGTGYLTLAVHCC